MNPLNVRIHKKMNVSAFQEMEILYHYYLACKCKPFADLILDALVAYISILEVNYLIVFSW